MWQMDGLISQAWHLLENSQSLLRMRLETKPVLNLTRAQKGAFLESFYRKGQSFVGIHFFLDDSREVGGVSLASTTEDASFQD